jgi:hypothetical protein
MVLSGIVLVLQRFFLCGRFVFGPDVRSLAVTIFLIVAPLVCFCVFVGRHLFHHYGNAGIAIIVVAAVYTVYVSSAIFYTLDRKCGVCLLAQELWVYGHNIIKDVFSVWMFVWFVLTNIRFSN